jgi:hypothetical protein
MNKQRRVFMLATVGAGLVGTASIASAQKPGQVVEESDPQAVALGYISDSAKIDKKKHTKYVGGSQCANCQLFQGKPKEPTGLCPLFPNKQVNAKGWCSTWVKKAS